MDSGKDLTHHYHASASAFGGRLEYPIDVTLPVLAATSLPSVGGYAQAEHENFTVDDMISIGKAYTQVSGSLNPTEGTFDTTVIAVIEKVNIANLLFADRIAMQISTKHPPDGYHPTVSFDGSEYAGLRTADCEFTPELSLDAFKFGKGEQLHPRGWLYNPKLREFARNQSGSIAGGAKKLSGKNIPFFQRLLDRHKGDGPNSDKAIDKRGNVICSVVKDIHVKGKCQGESVGHTIYVPGFGRVFLGELIVDGTSFNLTMLRVDMGSAATGRGSGSQGTANGTNTGGI